MSRVPEEAGDANPGRGRGRAPDGDPATSHCDGAPEGRPREATGHGAPEGGPALAQDDGAPEPDMDVGDLVVAEIGAVLTALRDNLWTDGYGRAGDLVDDLVAIVEDYVWRLR